MLSGCCRAGTQSSPQVVELHLSTILVTATMNFSIEHEQETDGRWLAEVPELPGVLAYGTSAEEAMAKAEVLALRVLAERLEQGESRPIPINISFAAA
jgi:predicted RNase H-like HicB family nuclease